MASAVCQKLDSANGVARAFYEWRDPGERWGATLPRHIRSVGSRTRVFVVAEEAAYRREVPRSRSLISVNAAQLGELSAALFRGPLLPIERSGRCGLLSVM